MCILWLSNSCEWGKERGNRGTGQGVDTGMMVSMVVVKAKGKYPQYLQMDMTDMLGGQEMSR